jgi:hypothetical protein
MGAVAYLLLMVLAALVSAQLLILMDRGVPLRKRLHEYGVGGDATFLLVAVLLVGSTVGAFAGYFLDAVGVGATVGLAVGFGGWIVAAAWSHTHPRPSSGSRRRS